MRVRLRSFCGNAFSVVMRSRNIKEEKLCPHVAQAEMKVSKPRSALKSLQTSLSGGFPVLQ